MKSIYFDGGSKKDLICIVDKETNQVIIRKQPEGSNHYEYEALNLALDYITKFESQDVELIGDSLETVRFIRNCTISSDLPDSASQIQKKCASKIKNNLSDINAVWVKRDHNLAGRVLEHYVRHGSKETEFIAEWNKCHYCDFVSLSKKETNNHFWNAHIMFSS